jgi:hypothetical protein
MAGADLMLAADAAALLRLSAQLAPSSVYLRLEDNLRITSYNSLASVVLNIRSRVLSCEGKVQASADVQTPNTDRSAKASILVTDEGWLLGGDVFVSGAAPITGQTFVVVEIVRGNDANSATPLQVIAAGYVTAKQPLTFPGDVRSSLAGPGAIRAITGTDPAPAVEITEAVPTGARWRVISLRATLVTDANVANRNAAFGYDDGATTLYLSQSDFAHTAGLSIPYNVAGHGYRGAPSAGFDRVVGWPTPVLLAGQRLKTVTSSMQVGDNWSAPQMLVEEWLEAA